MPGPRRWWREQMRLAREEARVRDLARAHRLRKRNRDAASEAVLRRVLRSFPPEAQAERMLRDLACAPDFERAFEADSVGIEHGADLAIAYLEDGRAGDALDVIARALEHHPGNERLLDLRARIQVD